MRAITGARPAHRVAVTTTLAVGVVAACGIMLLLPLVGQRFLAAPSDDPAGPPPPPGNAEIVIVRMVNITQPAPQTAPDTVLRREIRLPLDEGRLEFGDLIADLVEEMGFDGRAIRNELKISLDLNSILGSARLRLLGALSRGILEIDIEPDELVVGVDRVKLRRKSYEFRNALQTFLEEFFPEAAAAVHAGYGLWVYPADGTTPKPLADADISQNQLGRIVLVVHGLDEPGKVWRSLAPALQEKGYTVCEFRYANDQALSASTREFATALARLRDMGVTRVDLVCHSMGGLIARELLTNPRFYAGRAYRQERYPDVDHFIMVGTPNHGSQLARFRFAGEVREQVTRMLSDGDYLFNGFFDGAGQAKIDLLPDSEFLATLNARPHPTGVRMTIIAGRASPVSREKIQRAGERLGAMMPERTNDKIRDVSLTLEQIVGGVGDGAVPIESTRLDGVGDHVVVKGNHLTIIRTFRSSSTRQPPAIPLILDRLTREVSGREEF